MSKTLPRPTPQESFLAIQKLLGALDDAIGKLRVQVDGIDRDLFGIHNRIEALEQAARAGNPPPVPFDPIANYTGNPR